MRWYSNYPSITLDITLADARDCSHAGDCEADVLDLMVKPAIARQLKKVNPADLVSHLSEYGAWEPEELTDHEENLKRLLWLACCDISEEHA